MGLRQDMILAAQCSGAPVLAVAGLRRVYTRYDKQDALSLGCILWASLFAALRSVNTPQYPRPAIFVLAPK